MSDFKESYFDFLKTVEHCEFCKNTHWLVKKETEKYQTIGIRIICEFCGKTELHFDVTNCMITKYG